eukprot:gene22722-29417_t
MIKKSTLKESIKNVQTQRPMTIMPTIQNNLEYDKAVLMSQAMELTDEARVICAVQCPHAVLHANKAWTLLTGYQQHEVQGKTLNVLQGEQTSIESIQQMMHNVRQTGFGKAEVINYHKSGTPFLVLIRIQPIVASNIFGEKHVSHLLGRLTAKELTPNTLPSYAISKQQWEGYEWMINNTLFHESDSSCSVGNDDSSAENSDSNSEENNRSSPNGTTTEESSDSSRSDGISQKGNQLT